MTDGGGVLALVTVTVPLALVMTRIGATTRAVAAVRVVGVDVVGVEAVADVDDAVAGVATGVTRRLASGGLAARVGLGLADDVSVGVRMVVLAPVAADVVVGPAANCPGVAAIAAVVGVSVVLVIVGVVVIAAVVGVAATLVVEMVGAALVAPTVAAAVVPVVAPPPTSARNAASSVGDPPVTTGVGAELMDAFTVICGLA
jgi:hypothetical protein